MISIVIPLYNKEKQIANTLQTVFDQTFQQFEIVIVNDGSSDRSVGEVEKCNDARIRLIHQENAGVSAARNRGIQESQYDLIAFLDADDEWKPEYLQTQYELLQKYPECSVFACNYELKNTNGQIKPTIIRKLQFSELDGVLDNYFEVASCSHPPICSISIMVRKEAIIVIGGFPVDVKSGEDLLTWARLAVKYKIAYSKKICATFVLDESHNIDKKPIRIHDEKDIVGNELKSLYLNNHTKNRRYLGKYLSHWYKMRASVFMRLSNKSNTIKYSLKSLRYDLTNWKNFVFILIVLLPEKLQIKIRKKYSEK